MTQKESQASSSSIKQATNEASKQAITAPIAQSDTRTDRSFDAIADHFEKKVYGGLRATFGWQYYAVIFLTILRS